jgi:FAD/FMN-containing dehydrogenase
VLIEIASAEPGHAMAATERLLGGALEAGLIDDAAVAQNETQAKAFWNLRESQSAAQKPEGTGWKHDVAVPISSTAAFIGEATAAVEAFAPGVRVVAFGHLGDGNIHFNVVQPVGADGAPYAAMRARAAEIVHDIAASYGGSISAEHGLGVMKTAEALRYKTPEEVAAMKAVRAALDPGRILNPRVLF